MTTPKRPAVVRWTSAKRPPDGAHAVLVYVPYDGAIELGYFFVGRWHVYGQGFPSAVSHWRPLPPPPRVRAKR